MRKISIVVAVLAAALVSSSIVSAEENAAGHAAVTAVIEHQKQMEAIGRGAGQAAEAAHNSTAWLDALQRNSYKRPCLFC